MDRITAAAIERKRKSSIRRAADVAALLNYHVKFQRTPPAWAVNRMVRFPSYFAEPVRERLEGKFSLAAVA